MDPHTLTPEQVAAMAAAGSASGRSVLLIISLVLGVGITFLDSRRWPITLWQRVMFFQSVFVGGLAGSILPGFFAGGLVESQARQGTLSPPRSILGALVGGFVGALLFKKIGKYTFDTSDAFARGTCVAMIVGRLGCFAGHCCVGRPSHVFGMDLGDGVPRFPSQLAEVAFMTCVLVLILWLHHKDLLGDRRFFLLVALYGLGRIFLELLRAPVGGMVYGLWSYQWFALGLLLFGGFHVVKRTLAQRAAV